MERLEGWMAKILVRTLVEDIYVGKPQVSY